VGTVCRTSAGICDLQETCSGSSASCPIDAKSTAVCRLGTDLCDAAESCDGVGNACPPDLLAPLGTPCRAAAGPCDAVDACTGLSAACPADGFKPSGTICRSSVGVCDVADACTGASAACPPDAVAPAGGVCRSAAGVCDVADTCNGVSNVCPTDVKSTAVCRPASGACDVADSCDGVNNACPADAVAASGVECRPSAFPCDTAEVCDGTAKTCPADAPIVDADGDGTCDPLDDCPTIADPAQQDGDGDGLGDVCDPCTNVVPVAAVKPKLTMSKLLPPGGDDRLKFKGIITVPTTPVIDPSVHGIRIVVTDDDGSVLVDATVPGGATWIVRSGARTAWIYRDKLGTADGIVKATLKSGVNAGEIKFLISAKTGSFAMPTGPDLKATLVLDTPNATTGQCGEAEFVAPSCRLLSTSGRTACKL
jgi:hypothetical protein